MTDSIVTLKRDRGVFVYEDKAAGYYRQFTPDEWQKLGALWHSLEYDRMICEGKIPER